MNLKARYTNNQQKQAGLPASAEHPTQGEQLHLAVSAFHHTTNATQQLLAVGSMQGVLYFIDLQARKVVPPTLQLPKAIFDLQLQNDSLYIGGGDGVLSVLDVQTLTLNKTLRLSDASIRSIALHPSIPQFAAIGCSDHHIYLVDLEKWQVVQKLKQLDKNKTYLLYCRSGNRSGKTLKVMKKLGFKSAYNMQGGMKAWIRANYPVSAPK